MQDKEILTWFLLLQTFTPLSTDDPSSKPQSNSKDFVGKVVSGGENNKDLEVNVQSPPNETNEDSFEDDPNIGIDMSIKEATENEDRVEPEERLIASRFSSATPIKFR